MPKRSRAVRFIQVTAATLLLLPLSRPALGEGSFQLSLGQGLGAIGLMGEGAGLIDLGSISSLSPRIGYRFGQLIPFFGIDYSTLSYEEESKECYYDWDRETDRRYTSCDTYKSDADVKLYTLQVGARYLFSPPTTGKAHPYLTGALFTAIPSSDIDDSVDDTLDDTSSWGFLASFGIEYVVSPHLYLSGELGVKRFAMSFEISDGNEYDKGKLATMDIYSSVMVTFEL